MQPRKGCKAFYMDCQNIDKKFRIDFFETLILWCSRKCCKSAWQSAPQHSYSSLINGNFSPQKNSKIQTIIIMPVKWHFFNTSTFDNDADKVSKLPEKVPEEVLPRVLHDKDNWTNESMTKLNYKPQNVDILRIRYTGMKCVLHEIGFTIKT